jgi:hypothetical protein
MQSNRSFSDTIQFEEASVNEERLVEVPWPADA